MQQLVITAKYCTPLVQIVPVTVCATARYCALPGEICTTVYTTAGLTARYCTLLVQFVQQLGTVPSRYSLYNWYALYNGTRYFSQLQFVQQLGTPPGTVCTAARYPPGTVCTTARYCTLPGKVYTTVYTTAVPSWYICTTTRCYTLQEQFVQQLSAISSRYSLYNSKELYPPGIVCTTARSCTLQVQFILQQGTVPSRYS